MLVFQRHRTISWSSMRARPISALVGKSLELSTVATTKRAHQVLIRSECKNGPLIDNFL